MSRAVALLLGLLWVAGCEPKPPIGVEEPWVRSFPKTKSVTAGYLTLTNHSGTGYRLVALSSPQFESVELHETVEVDGMMRMRARPNFEIRPGEEARLTPGGLHLMLMGARVPRDDDMTELTLTFDPPFTVTVTAPMRSTPPTGR